MAIAISKSKIALKSHLAIGAVAVSLFAATGAKAQDQGQDEAARSDGREILVTARKIEENIQDVPIAITAFSGETFAEAGLTEFADIARLTPNFDVSPNGATGSLFANVTIRGQSGGFITLNADQAVGININGAPITRGTSLFTNLFDIEQIEILKGPQGTLFGKNTTGGVVNVTTKAPELGVFSGYVEGTYGSFERTELEGVINVPLGENAALRLGAAKTDRDGFGEGGIGATLTLTGRDLADDDETFVRGSLLVEPSDGISIRINADYHDVDESGSIFRSLRSAFLFGVIPIALETINPDFFVGNDFRDEAPFAISDEFNINATIEADLGGTTLTSITSYRDQSSDTLLQSAPGTSIRLAQESDIFAQELRLAGSAIQDQLSWQVGAFYSDEEGIDLDQLPEAGVITDTAAENETFSVFAQGTFALTDQLNITGGVRYTDEQRRVTGIAAVNLGQENEASFDAFSWLVSLDYKPTPETLVYASISRGFRSGAIDQDNIDTIVDPEFVVNYEVGFKSDLFDDVVRFNASAFYSDYTDIQRTSFDPDAPAGAAALTTVLRNAAEATIWGFESELQVSPIPGLSFGGTLGYTNAEFDEFLDLDAAGNILDRSEDPLGGPEWQVSLDGRYETDLSANVVLGVQANYFYRGEEDLAGPTLAALLAPGETVVDSYGLVNAQIDLDLIDVLPGVRDLNIAVFATNLFDKEYFTGGLAIGAFGGISNRIVGEPQQFGVRVRAGF